MPKTLFNPQKISKNHQPTGVIRPSPAHPRCWQVFFAARHCCEDDSETHLQAKEDGFSMGPCFLSQRLQDRKLQTNWDLEEIPWNTTIYPSPILRFSFFGRLLLDSSRILLIFCETRASFCFWFILVLCFFPNFWPTYRWVLETVHLFGDISTYIYTRTYYTQYYT